jgi:hypothetical protein
MKVHDIITHHTILAEAGRIYYIHDAFRMLGSYRLPAGGVSPSSDHTIGPLLAGQ